MGIDLIPLRKALPPYKAMTDRMSSATTDILSSCEELQKQLISDASTPALKLAADIARLCGRLSAFRNQTDRTSGTTSDVISFWKGQDKDPMCNIADSLSANVGGHNVRSDRDNILPLFHNTGPEPRSAVNYRGYLLKPGQTIQEELRSIRRSGKAVTRVDTQVCTAAAHRLS